MKKNKWGMTPNDAMVTEIVLNFLLRVFTYGISLILAGYFYYYLFVFFVFCVRTYVESGIK
jgi:hypothetical protein